MLMGFAWVGSVGRRLWMGRDLRCWVLRWLGNGCECVGSRRRDNGVMIVDLWFFFGVGGLYCSVARGLGVGDDGQTSNAGIACKGESDIGIYLSIVDDTGFHGRAWGSHLCSVGGEIAARDDQVMQVLRSATGSPSESRARAATSTTSVVQLWHDDLSPIIKPYPHPYMKGQSEHGNHISVPRFGFR